MKVPIFSLEASNLHELNMHRKVFNVSTIEYYLWIHLPGEVLKDCELFQLDDVSDGLKEVSSWYKFVEREDKKPWLKLVTKLLDLSIGQHTYKLSFVNTFTQDVVPVYISYIIQDDKPEKPYVYMNNCCSCEGSK